MKYVQFILCVAMNKTCSYSNKNILHKTFKVEDLDFDITSFEVNEDGDLTNPNFCIESKIDFLNRKPVTSISINKNVSFVYLKTDKSVIDLWSFNYLKNSESIIDAPEFKITMQKYIEYGWKLGLEEENEEIVSLIKEQDIADEEKRAAQCKADGSILWERAYYYSPKRQNITTETFKGGFSDEVFDTLKPYIGNGTRVNGYVGHMARTKETDIAIETGLRQLNMNVNRMWAWITSSDGRHTMDWIEGSTNEEKVEYLQAKMNAIYNMCLIYSDPEHNGMFNSTLEIREKYEKEGLLLSEIKI